MRTTGKSNTLRDLALEALVIVSSILLAFSLDTWWDARGERGEEHVVLQNLAEEFTAAGDQLDVYIAFHRRIAGAARATLASVQEALETGRRFVTVSDTMIALLYIPPTFNPRLGTLEGLLSSGRLGLLGDPELRQSLAGWAGLLAEGTEEEQKGVYHVFDHLDPVLRSRMDVSEALGITEALLADMLSEEQRSAVSRLPVDTEVTGVLALRARIIEHGIDDLERVREEIDRIIVLIEPSLRRGNQSQL